MSSQAALIGPRRSKRIAGLPAEAVPLPINIKRERTIRIKKEAMVKEKEKEEPKLCDIRQENLKYQFVNQQLKIENKQLATEICKLRVENEELKLRQTCTICMDAIVSTCLTPCGHTYCRNCVKSFTRMTMQMNGVYNSELICPTCRATYTKIQPLYFVG